MSEQNVHRQPIAPDTPTLDRFIARKRAEAEAEAEAAKPVVANPVEPTPTPDELTHKILSLARNEFANMRSVRGLIEKCLEPVFDNLNRDALSLKQFKEQIAVAEMKVETMMKAVTSTELFSLRITALNSKIDKQAAEIESQKERIELLQRQIASHARERI